jgi:MSHA biogenesis protein MshJ
MKATWQRWSVRFAALKQRERGLVVLGSLVVMLVLSYLLVLQPQLAKRAQLNQQIVQQQTDTRALQEQVQALNQKRQNPDAVSRAQLVDTQQQLRVVNNQFKELQQALVTPQEMAHVLEELLQHNHGLQLKSLRTLPMVSVSDMLAAKAEKDGQKPGTTDKPVSTPAKEGREAWLYRHGVEITVQGRYGDMLAYLSELEQLPRRVYWGELRLSADTYPVAVLTVTLYTLSLEKMWLIV